MDQVVQCYPLVAVQHIVLGTLTAITTVLCTFLVHRRVRADRERRVRTCKWCMDHHRKFNGVHEGMDHDEQEADSEP